MESENENGPERSNNINILTSERIKTLAKFRRHSTRLQGICNNLETVSEQEQENVRPCLVGDETQSILPHRYDRRRSGLIKENIYDNNLSELPIHSSININRSRRRSSLLQKQNDVDKPSDISASCIQRNPVDFKHGFDYKSTGPSGEITSAVAPASKGFITQRRTDDTSTNELTEEEKMAIEATLEEQEDVTVRLNSLRRRSELGDMFDNIKSHQANLIESEPKLSCITKFRRKSILTGYQKEESKVLNQNDKVPNNIFNTPDHKKVYSHGNVSNDTAKEYKVPTIHVDFPTCEKLQLKSGNKRRYFDEEDTENASQTRTRNISGSEKEDSDQAGNMVKRNFPDWFKPQNSFVKYKENDKSKSTYLSQNYDNQINENQTEMRTPISENKTPRSLNKLSSNVMVKKNLPEWFKPTTSIGKNRQTRETGLTDFCQGYDIAASPYKVYEKERKKRAMQAIAPIIEAARERRKSHMLLQKSSSKKQTPEVVTRNRNIDLLKSNRNLLSCKSPVESKSLIKTPSMLKKGNISVDFQECRRALEYEQEKDEHSLLIPPGTPLEQMTPSLEKISGPSFRGTKISINKPSKAVTADIISNSFIEEPKSHLSQNTVKPVKRKSLLIKRKSLLVMPNSFIEENKSFLSQNTVKLVKRKSLLNRDMQSKLKPPVVQTSKCKSSYTAKSNKNVVNDNRTRSKILSNKQEFVNKQRIKTKTPVKRRSSIILPPAKSSKKKRKSVGNTKLPRSKLNQKDVTTSTEKVPENNQNDDFSKSEIRESPCSSAVGSETVGCDASTSTGLQWNNGSMLGLDTDLMDQVVQLEAEHERIMVAAQTLVEQTALRRKRMKEQGMLIKFGESISPLKRLRTLLTSKPSSVAIVEQLCEEETQEECTTPGNKSVRFNKTIEIHDDSNMDITCSPSSGNNSFLLNETSLNASGMDGAGVNSLNNSVHHLETLKNANTFLKTPASQKLKPFKKPNSVTTMGPPTILSEEQFTDGSNSPFTELVGDCERPSIAPYMTPHSRQQVSVLKDALNRQLADLFD